ncbi:MAG: hypothetical protein GMKNLPBB_01945 [Myxococcota bacterium]|nr:hypothetical protein [Myxococcota bacterium]
MDEGRLIQTCYAVAILLGVFACAGCTSGSSVSPAGVTNKPKSANAAGNIFDNDEAPRPRGDQGSGASPPDAGQAPPPPEQEIIPIRYQRPATTRNYVYVANETLGKVIRIDPETRQVASIPVGGKPGEAVAIEGEDAAAVLNRGDGSLSLIISSPETDVVHTVSLGEPYENLALSPGGQYAVAWFDRSKPEKSADGQSASSIAANQIAVVNLSRLRQGGANRKEVVETRTVGFRATNVFFNKEGTRAFVVAKSEVSVADLGNLAAQPLLPRLRINDKSFEEVERREVLADAGGRYLYLRSLDADRLIALDMVNNQKLELKLPSAPSDLDLSPNGAMAVAVLRGDSSVAVFPVPGVFTDPSSIRIIKLGSAAAGSAVMSPVRNEALLFTNAEYREQLSTVNLDKGEVVTFDSRHGLDKAVLAAEYAPDGSSALILHAYLAASPPFTSVEEQVDATPGYSLFNLQAGVFALERLTSDVKSWVFSPDGARLALLIPSKDAFEVQLADMRSLLKVSSVRFQSNPEFMGALPGSRWVYITHKHPAGRITFMHFDTGEVRTITGFDLNSNAD